MARSAHPQNRVTYFDALDDFFSPIAAHVITNEFPGILWPQKKVSKRSLEVDSYVLINKVKSADNSSVYENYRRCVSGHVVILL